MSLINTNISGQVAVNAITKNDREQEHVMERLSTGLRINSAKNDAAGLAITERMKAEVSGLEMATRNANDTISMLETAEGATREIASALQRMRELAVQAASSTYSDTDRLALDLEFGELWLEMQRIATQTTWNTMTVLNGGNDLQTAGVHIFEEPKLARALFFTANVGDEIPRKLFEAVAEVIAIVFKMNAFSSKGKIPKKPEITVPQELQFDENGNNL